MPVVLDDPTIKELRQLPADFLDGAEWHGSTLRTDVPEQRDRAFKPYISASTASTINGCAARQWVEKQMPDLSGPTDPRNLGTTGHAVLEDLMKLEPAERTLERAMQMHAEREAKVVAEHGLAGRELLTWRTYTQRSISGVFELEDLPAVDVYAVEFPFSMVEIEPGIIANGFVDRVTRNPDGTLSADDYKFGKEAKKPNPRFGDSYGDQVRVYKQAIEQVTGEQVTTGNLIYGYAGTILPVDLSDDAIATTNANLRKARALLDRGKEEGAYDAKPSALCGWCPLANSCPVARVTSEKAIANAETQPTFDIPQLPASRAIRPTSRGVIEAPAATAYGEVETVTETEEATMTITEAPAELHIVGEDKQWEQFLPDGGLNPNSYAAVASTALWGFAFEQVRAAREAEKQRAEGEPRWLYERRDQTLQITTELAQALGTVCTRVQRSAGGQGGFHAGINNRVRPLVYKAVELLPVPFGAPAADFAAWLGRVELMAFEMLRHAWAVHLITDSEHGDYALLSDQNA